MFNNLILLRIGWIVTSLFLIVFIGNLHWGRIFYGYDDWDLTWGGYETNCFIGIALTLPGFWFLSPTTRDGFSVKMASMFCFFMFAFGLAIVIISWVVAKVVSGAILITMRPFGGIVWRSF